MRALRLLCYAMPCDCICYAAEGAYYMNSQLSAIWDGAMRQIKDIVNDIVYKTYFEPIAPVALSSSSLVLCVNNDFVKNYLIHNYSDLIYNSVAAVSKREFAINILLPTEAGAYTSASDGGHGGAWAGGGGRAAHAGAGFPSALRNGEVNNVTLLNSRYTFDSFVSYSGNMVAHAASVAVAEQAAKAYNPLFLYGGAGLGKTHLMHAVGNYVIAQRPTTKVVYVSSEKFTNEFVNAIRDDRMNDFRDRYRNVDLLLLDDVQFFGRKERAQEELFYTFNELYDANKKIVLSSDKKPSEIPMIEERLVTRFEWGLTADIQPPDYETRVAILRKKAQIQEIDVPDDIMNYIAELITQNIRKLEGALNKVVAYSSVTGYAMDLNLAEEALKEIVNKKEGREITSRLIIDVVSRYFNLNDDEFVSSKKRIRTTVFPRQVAMYLCRELLSLSLGNIGTLFGRRDHTTALHSINKVKDEMLVNGDVKRMIDDLISDIKGEG